jgi:hypothetical protein
MCVQGSALGKRGWFGERPVLHYSGRGVDPASRSHHGATRSEWSALQTISRPPYISPRFSFYFPRKWSCPYHHPDPQDEDGIRQGRLRPREYLKAIPSHPSVATIGRECSRRRLPQQLRGVRYHRLGQSGTQLDLVYRPFIGP